MLYNKSTLSSDFSSDEAEMLRKIAAKDERAFRVMYDRFYNKIYNFSYRLINSEQLAEEVVQETMLKIWNLGDKLFEIGALDSYLKTIARNRTIDILRRKELEKRTEKDLTNNWEDYNNDTEEQILLRDTRKILDDAIGKLPEYQRAVYQLCHLEGLKYDEAAERLGLSANTVQTYMKLALRFLRTYLKQHTDVAAIFIIFKLF